MEVLIETLDASKPQTKSCFWTQPSSSIFYKQVLSFNVLHCSCSNTIHLILPVLVINIMRHSQFSICENDTSFFKPKAIGFAVAHPLEFADNSQKCVSDHFCKIIIMKSIVHIGHFICMAKTIKKRKQLQI